MKVRSYIYMGLAIIAALCGVMAITFYRLGFVGMGPFVLALVLVSLSLFGFVKSLPKDRKKAKPKKGKKAADAAADVSDIPAE